MIYRYQYTCIPFCPLVRPVSPTPVFTVKPSDSGVVSASELSNSRPRWILMEDDGLVPGGADIQASLPISPASMSYKVK